MAKVVPLLQRDRFQSLKRSTGEGRVFAAVAKTEIYKKLVTMSFKL